MKQGNLIKFSEKLLAQYRLSSYHVFIMYEDYTCKKEKSFVYGDEILLILDKYEGAVKVLKNNCEDGWIVPKLFEVLE